jgi:hypothetical protein
LVNSVDPSAIINLPNSLKIPDEPENAPITPPMTETRHARENSIFWAIFANFVTFPTHSKIPSVTRDRFEYFLKFSAL